MIGSKQKTLTAALPVTRRLSRSAFQSLLERFGKVIVKPTGAARGLGIMQVASLGDDTYEVHYDKRKKTIEGLEASYLFIKKRAKKGPNIVQQKIPLAKFKGKPFDIRVMVQKNGRSSWTVTGKLAKVAGSGFIITNTARSRGSIVTVPTAVRGSKMKRPLQRICKDMDRISLLAVKRLTTRYRWIDTVGMDIGLDLRGKTWIIEANFMPSKSLFLKLKDKSMYRRIVSLYRKRKRM